MAQYAAAPLLRPTIYTHRPPSTSSTTPVRNSASADARNNAALATSCGTERRPSGTEATNLARTAGSSLPRNIGSSAVSPATGARAHTRILSGANSTAIDFDNKLTAPLVALYQARPGRGLSPAVEPMLMITPRPARRNTG